MKPLVAVKKYLEAGERGIPVSLSDFREFWSACTPEERSEYAVVAAKELGVDLDLDPVPEKK